LTTPMRVPSPLLALPLLPLLLLLSASSFNDKVCVRVCAARAATLAHPSTRRATPHGATRNVERRRRAAAGCGACPVAVAVSPRSLLCPLLVVRRVGGRAACWPPPTRPITHHDTQFKKVLSLPRLRQAAACVLYCTLRASTLSFTRCRALTQPTPEGLRGLPATAPPVSNAVTAPTTARLPLSLLLLVPLPQHRRCRPRRWRSSTAALRHRRLDAAPVPVAARPRWQLHPHPQRLCR
jgi:hypothetical protein